MKENNWLKAVAIIMAVALVFTIVTSNIVSITAISVLKSAKSGTVIQGGDSAETTTQPTGGDNSNSDNTPNAGDETDNTTNAAQVDNTTAAGSSGGNATTTAKKTDSNMPQTKAEVYDFYKAAIKKVQGGAAGHTRKEWQSVEALEVGGNEKIGNLIKSFVTEEDKAGEAISEKGSDDAKKRIAPCGAPITRIKSATCVPSGNNYKVTIVMNDEVSPKKGSDGIAAMATGILYMEDVENEIANNSVVKILVKELNSESKITYKGYTIVATITKDGKFVEMKHTSTGDIIASAKLIIGSINGSGTLIFHSHWYDFKY